MPKKSKIHVSVLEPRIMPEYYDTLCGLTAHTTVIARHFGKVATCKKCIAIYWKRTQEKNRAETQKAE